MDKIKIIVADDESRMRKLVKDFLVRENYQVLEAENGEKAVDLFYDNGDTDLIILDVMMPVMDGWEACREIRETSKVPIIMLTAKSDEQDELKGFDLGVDEYITKPFSPKVLVARVKALMRRSNKLVDEKSLLKFGELEMNLNSHTVTACGQEVDLSVKEFELMQFFIENSGQALSRETILNNVWNYDYFGDARTIDTHVKKLRSKLGEKCGAYIKTVWGFGYKFEV